MCDRLVFFFLLRCESDERKLTSALISWHKFNCMEKELNSLLQCSDHHAADAEPLDDLEVSGFLSLFGVLERKEIERLKITEESCLIWFYPGV